MQNETESIEQMFIKVEKEKLFFQKWVNRKRKYDDVQNCFAELKASDKVQTTQPFVDESILLEETDG